MHVQNLVSLMATLVTGGTLVAAAGLVIAAIVARVRRAKQPEDSNT
jgi:hypothetical protein